MKHFLLPHFLCQPCKFKAWSPTFLNMTLSRCTITKTKRENWSKRIRSSGINHSWKLDICWNLIKNAVRKNFECLFFFFLSSPRWARSFTSILSRLFQLFSSNKIKTNYYIRLRLLLKQYNVMNMITTIFATYVMQFDLHGNIINYIFCEYTSQSWL